MERLAGRASSFEADEATLSLSAARVWKRRFVRHKLWQEKTASYDKRQRQAMTRENSRGWGRNQRVDGRVFRVRARLGHRSFQGAATTGVVGTRVSTCPATKKSTADHNHKRPTTLRLVHAPDSGWNEVKTSKGEVYFVNHLDKTTTWDRPAAAPAEASAAAAAAAAPPPVVAGKHGRVLAASWLRAGDPCLWIRRPFCWQADPRMQTPRP